MSVSFGAQTGLVLVDARPMAGRCYLPLSAGLLGRTVIVKDQFGVAGVSSIQIYANAPDTFEDGTSSRWISQGYGFMTITATASNVWTVVGGSTQPAFQASTLSTFVLNAQTVTAHTLSTGTAYIGSLSSANLTAPSPLFSTVQHLDKGSGTYVSMALSSSYIYLNGVAAPTIVIPSQLLSTTVSLGTTGYISTLTFQSTLDGLGTATYVSSPSLTSSLAGLGNAGYVSTVSLYSTLAGLGTLGYISTTEDNLRTTSTIAGLGGLGFVSSQSGLVTISSLQTSSIAASMRGIQFLLAGTGSVTSTGVFYSQDGVTASNATLLPQATNFTDAAVSPNGFLQSPGGVEYVLAVDSPIKLYVSNNLTSWTAVGAVPTATVKSIGFGSNASLPIYVVATAGTGLNSLQFRRSTDVSFITTPTAGGFSGGGTRVAYNPASDRWVATGVDSLASTLQYTTTLTSWTASAGPTFSTVANSVIWAPGFSRFYAVGKAAVSTATIKMSADGITWSNAVSGGFANCNLGALDIAYGNVGGTTPTLVAVGEGAPGGAISTIQWSTDGLNFSNATAGGFVSTNFAAGNTIAYSATLGQWMAAGGVSSVLTSADGKAWANTAIQRPAGFTAARIFAPNAPYYTTLPIIAGPEALFQGGRQIVDTGYLNLFLATKTFGTSTFSTLTVAQLAQISSVSANTVIAPLVSTLALNVSSINGTVYGSFIGSTTFLSAASALISSATLQNLAATQGYVSSLIVDSFQLGSNAAFFNMGDVIATSLSTIQLNTGILYTNSTLLGNTSSQTAIQFYGNAGAYNQTVLAEQSTGSGLQEFVVFRGSSASDRIRMQTTGSIVFEPGVSSRLWPNVASNVTPALMINTASNVGIQTATPAFPLDVAGTARAQTISTLGLNVSSINGTVYSVFSGSTTSLSAATIYVSSLAANALTTSTLQVNTSINMLTGNITNLSGEYFATPKYTTTFSPLMISGCSLWMDAQDPYGNSTQPTNGTTFFSIKDKSASNHPLTSLGATFNSTAINGLPGFNVATNQDDNRYIGFDPGSAVNNWQEVFIVAYWTGGGSTFPRYTGLFTTLNEQQFFVGDLGGAGWYGNNFGNTPFMNGVNTNTAFPAITSPFVARNNSGGGSSGSRGIRLGYDRGNAGRAWLGFIGEVICYGTALTNAQRLQVEGYLAWKWGINPSFSPIYTYYSTPPPPFGTVYLAAGSIAVDAGSNIVIQAAAATKLSLLGAVQATGAFAASTMSTSLLTSAQINTSSINGQTPIYLSTMISTVAGLNSNISSMIDPTELTSTVVGLGSIGIVSTLGVTSTIQGLGSAGYVSTATLNSSINALKLSVSTNYLSAAQIQVASGYISSLTVDSLALGSNAAFFTMGDVLATSISTFQVNTGVLYMNSTFIGNASSLTALQFYGNAGAYNQTVLAEVSTGSGLQEFLVFRGSSASDRIRMQTTGTIVFEPGVTSRLWPNVASNVTPAMVINTASNVGIQTATPVAPLDVAGTARAQTLSTLALNVCTINGFIPWQPSYLQSTVQGLGQTYVSTASLVSSMASLRTSISTINISAATIQAAQLSTLNLQVCTINGAAPGTGSGSGTTFVGSTIFLSAATIQASTLSSLTFQANTGYVSSLTVDSLQIGSNAAFISLGDSIATSLSTIVVRSGVVNASQLNASTISTTTLFTQSTLLGISSLQTAIQFYGLTGNYTNTVLAEQSTSATSQEFIVFRGSSATDRIRMQTTGNIVFEPGVTARMWPNTPSNVTPALIINTASNIGILTATPTVPLDVAGIGRFQMLSTLNLQVCTINGAAPGTGSGSGTTFVGSTIFLSSAQGFISSLTVNALTIGTTAGFTVMGDVIAASMSTINLNVSTINGALPGSGSGSSSAFNGSTITVSTLQLFDPALTFSSLGNLYVRSSLLLYNSTVVAGARQVQSQMFTF